MKNNWKETFRNDYTTKGYGDYRLWNESGNNVQKVEDFITNLLAEQKKELMNDFLKWAEDHYWDTNQGNEDLIVLHIKNYIESLNHD